MKITIEGLTKIYNNTVTALDGISLTIHEGMFGLLGPNGAGKTTLMRILATLLEPTSGTVKIGDFDVGKDKKEIRKLLGYLPQDFGVYPELTAYEFLDYMCLLHGIKDSTHRKKQILAALELVHLLDEQDQTLGTFSRGMIQRIGIAQSLLNAPQLLIVDEPTAGLDPEERVHFRNLLSEVSGERIVIISTHIVADIVSTCSDMMILKKGRILFRGNPVDLMKQAEGKIYTASVTNGELEELKKQGKIISIVKGLDLLKVRFVSDEKVERAVETRPTLEDAYIYATNWFEGIAPLHLHTTNNENTSTDEQMN